MTYKEQLDRLAVQMRNNPTRDEIATFMATSFMMQWEGGSAELDQNAVYDTTMKLRNQSAFKQMIKDPLALQLAKKGDHLGLIQLMDMKENEVRQANEAYNRTGKDVKDDASFLEDAVENLKNGSAVGRPAELEKKSRRYQEMIRQVEAAQQKTQSGVQLSAAESRALVTAVKSYIQGGTEIPGGNKKVPHFKEAMCVLKEYMPPQEFSRYCEQINEVHPKAKLDPASFTRSRMNNQIQTAAEIRQRARRQLAAGFSEEACAAVLAAQNLSKGDRNALITPADLEKEKARLLEKGSAFNRMMTNPKDREILKNIAREGKMARLGKNLEMGARNHAIGAAQWRVNRSVRFLTEGGPLNRHMATEHLATLFVSHELASNAGPGTKISKDALEAAKENIMKDPAFRQVADRYSSDPEYRKRINKDLTLDRSASILPLEVYKARNPRAERQQQGPQAQQGQNRDPQVQDLQRQQQGPMQAGPI